MNMLPSPAKFFQRLILPLLVALLALAVCGGALATSPPVTLDLTGYESFKEAWETTHPGFNPANVTELVIKGQSNRTNDPEPSDWKQVDGKYLATHFTSLETLDISGHTGGYSGYAFWKCKFKNVRLREDIKLAGDMFAGCANLTTLAVGNRAFTQDVIDLRGCAAGTLLSSSRPFNNSGIIRVRLPADADLGVYAAAFSLFDSCTSLTTLALGDRPFVEGVIDLTGYRYGDYISALFMGCESITRVRLPANVRPSERMFGSCKKLTTLALGDRPFVDNVVDLTGYSFPAYGSSLFSGCTGIEHARLPANVPLSSGMFTGSFPSSSNPSLTFFGGNAPTPSSNNPFSNPLPSGTLYYPQNATGYGENEFYQNLLSDLTRQFFVPLAITEPDDQDGFFGQDAAFTVTVTSGHKPNEMSYQWQILDPTSGIWTDVTDGGVYAGAKTNRLSLTNIPQSLNDALYRCAVASDRQLLLTQTARLTVSAPTPSPVPTPTPVPTSTPVPTPPPPKTGDGAQPILWAALGALALAGGLWLALAAKARRSRLDP